MEDYSILKDVNFGTIEFKIYIQAPGLFPKNSVQVKPKMRKIHRGSPRFVSKKEKKWDGLLVLGEPETLKILIQPMLVMMFTHQHFSPGRVGYNDIDGF
jgi:hypothetical protein